MLVARPMAEVLSLIDSSGCLAVEIKRLMWVAFPHPY